jgi:asparagine synthase (glutamine-hydrolysing)
MRPATVPVIPASEGADRKIGESNPGDNTMQRKILLSGNARPWIREEQGETICHVTGMLYRGDRLLEAGDLLPLFAPLPDAPGAVMERIGSVMQEVGGEFSLVLTTPRLTVCITDRIRSFPLFYAETADCFVVSDHPAPIARHLNNEVDEANAAELLVTGFVSGTGTLMKGIRQMQAGECLIFDAAERTLRLERYYTYAHGNPFSATGPDPAGTLDGVLQQVFCRLIATTAEKGDPVVVPLSGGLDSRIIVAWLKRLGLEDVTCFTYGKPHCPETAISRNVAKALDYPWHFIEYTPEKWTDCFRSGLMDEYQQYAGRYVTFPHIQDFLAVKELRETGIVPDRAVFVPGHGGDVLAGCQVPPDICKYPDYSFERLAGYLLGKHYGLWGWEPDGRLRASFEGKIRGALDGIIVRDRTGYADAVEYYDVVERQAKFIVNSVRTYEFFGYGWRLPFWDLEYMQFVSRLPLDARLQQSFYRRYTREKLFTGALKCLARIDCTTPIGADPKNRLFTMKRHISRVRNRFLPTPPDRWYMDMIPVLRAAPTPQLAAMKNHPEVRALVGRTDRNLSGLRINGLLTLYYLQLELGGMKHGPQVLQHFPPPGLYLRDAKNGLALRQACRAGGATVRAGSERDSS